MTTNQKLSGPSSMRESSLRTCVETFKNNGKEVAIDRAFHELDYKKTGRLDRSEITKFMEEAANLIRLELGASVISDAVDALMEDVGANPKEHITREQFDDIFERHPELLRCFEDEESRSFRTSSSQNQALTPQEMQQVAKENEQVWLVAHTRWKNEWKSLIWIMLYVAANITAFTYKAITYVNRDEATQVFGSCIVVARGAAQCLNFNCCLILLPICRRFLTRLRATKLRFLFPFDVVLEYHMWIGLAIAFFVTLHVSAHICDFYRFARADQEDLYALFGDKLGVIPDGISERWSLMLSQPAGVTGIIMLVCMLVAYPFILIRRKRFNAFWITHHLLLVMLIALCFHGIGNLLEPFQSVYWVILPLILYFIPRMWRETPLSKAKVKDIQVKRGDVVHLQLERPKSWDKNVRAGMYAYINIPKVSCLEWHPFTLTSAPCEDYIEFHFRRAGDWTGNVHGLLTETSQRANLEDDSPMESLTVKVEGPIGASSQGFTDHPVVVLIAAGIGVTPMISVLKQMIAYPGKMKRTFLYWTVRERASFEWFTSLMDEIYTSDKDNRLQIRHFLTSAKDDNRDVAAILLHHATRCRHAKTNFDLILGQHAHKQVEIGRPDWETEFRFVMDETKELGLKDCAIFLCGPENMAKAVSDVSFRLSKSDPNFHFYFRKETF
jgi:respiratory burst oxidase